MIHTFSLEAKALPGRQFQHGFLVLIAPHFVSAGPLGCQGAAMVSLFVADALALVC